MRAVQERWAKAGIAVVLTCACSGRPLEPGADAGVDRGAVRPPPADASPGRADGSPEAGHGGTDAVTPPRFCPPVDEVADEAPPAVAPAPMPMPTTAPFSCQPMPAAFIFAPPGADVPGLYSRCASFEVGAATALAVSPDGRLVALVTADGLARVVEIASRRVIAVLAPPRAMIDYAAFAPDGAGILTLARAQREVTLWRAADWTPVWTVSLPGLRYHHLFGGAVAFSPDGHTAAVSPGSDMFLLDAATGAVRVHWTTVYDTILDVAYGWNGRRIVVVEPSLAAHCIHEPNGGRVTILDAETLAGIASVDYGEYPTVRGQPRFRASPTEDLVYVPDPASSARLKALKLSDGSALPAPLFDTLPAAFMPDGRTVLIYDARALRRVRVDDGVVTSVAMLGDGGPVAVSADGGVVAFGGKGGSLLRTWSGDGPVETICGADEPPSSPPRVSLSRDGRRLALGTSTGVRVLRRDDGVEIASLPTPGSPTLSPSGERLVTAPFDYKAPAIVSRVADGVLLDEIARDQWNWSNFAFSPREDRLYGYGVLNNQFGLDVVDLAPPRASTVQNIPEYTALIGVSNGCPVLYQGERGVWRSCGTCEDPPLGSGGMIYDATRGWGAVLSADGKQVAIASAAGGAGVTLWRMPPDAAALGTIGQRADAPREPTEFPVAISPGGERLLTSTSIYHSCYSGPDFELHVNDVASGALLDALPPAPVAVDGAARTIAYGAQLWCAR